MLVESLRGHEVSVALLAVGRGVFDAAVVGETGSSLKGFGAGRTRKCSLGHGGRPSLLEYWAGEEVPKCRAQVESWLRQDRGNERELRGEVAL